jgi:poly-gamma-glutamate biosynthesis protein PgsC/CapC
MHNYGVLTEVVRMVLALGVIVSILVYERWHLTGGAAVVSGYLAMFVNRPLYIVTTLVLAVATYYIVQRLIANRMFLYGRRRLVVMVMTGMFLQLLTGLVGYITGKDIPLLMGLYGIGFVLPGLIAQDIERQGIRITMLTVLGTTFVTFFLFRNMIAIKDNLPMYWTTIAFEDKVLLYSYHTKFLILAVVLSVILSALLYEWTGIRSGGFLSAAYAALFVFKPLHLLFIAIVSTFVYFFVVHLLMSKTPIFGRTKFAMMVLTALVFTWGLEVLCGILTHNVFVPFAGFSIISPMMVALIANDGERQGLPRTLLGVAICTIVVFIAVKSIDLLIVG